MKKLSAGLILTDGTRLLVCHVTGRGFYDIPKGLVDPGENPLETCLRETEEETGLKVDPVRLRDLGTFTFTREKDLYLFLMTEKDLPPTENMRCRSYFTDTAGRMIPEVDGYRYISYAEKQLFLVPSMAEVIDRVQVIIKR